MDTGIHTPAPSSQQHTRVGVPSEVVLLTHIFPAPPCTRPQAGLTDDEGWDPTILAMLRGWALDGEVEGLTVEDDDSDDEEEAT